MDFDILCRELCDAEYAAMSDSEAADSLNAPSMERIVDLPGEKLLRWLAGKSKLPILEALKADQDPAKRNLALTVERLLQRAGTAVDLSQPTDQALVDYAVSIGVLSPDEKAELLGLVTEMVSRATALGLPPVGPHHVSHARSLLK